MKLSKVDKIVAGTALVILMGLVRYNSWLNSEEFRIGQYGQKDGWIFEIKSDGQYTRHEYWEKKWAPVKKPNPKLGPRNLTYTFNPDGSFMRHFKGTYVVAGTAITFIEDSGPNSFPRFLVRAGHITRDGLFVLRQFSVARMEDIGSGKILHDSGAQEQFFVKIKSLS